MRLRLLRELGVDVNYAFKSRLANKPPLPPSIHISRSETFEAIRESLAEYSTLAISSYPQSGKTIAISEFAASERCRVFWFNVPAENPTPASNYTLLCLQLCEHLQLGDFDHGALLEHLSNASNDSILLVIDNLQWWGDLRELADLRSIADGSRGALRLLLVTSDAPSVRQDLNTTGICEFRLPGLEVNSALAMFEVSQRHPLNEYQQKAVRLLVDATDGHVGLVRLFFRPVSSISSASELNAFVNSTIPHLGATAGNRKASLFEQFRQGLSTDQLELCKRLSLLFRPFHERVADRLWRHDRVPDSFFEVWTSCKISAFEAVDQTQYLLPELYRDGLRKVANPYQQRLWHRAIAEVLAEPVGNRMDPYDILDSIVHRILAGQEDIALRQAAVLLIHANETAPLPIQQLFGTLLQPLVQTISVTESVDLDSRAIWHAINAQTSRQIRKDLDTRNSITEVKRILASPQIVSMHPSIVSLCYITIAISALEDGDIAMVESAIAQLRDLRNQMPELMVEVEFLVLSAHVFSNRNPVRWLRTWLQTNSDLRGVLWNANREFKFWQGISACVYKCIDESDRDGTAERIEEARELVDELIGAGEFNVASLIGASVAKLIIDVERNAPKAQKYATEKFGELGGRLLSGDVEASLELVFGDTNRCCGDFKTAALHYAQALGKWGPDSLFEHAQTLYLQGIMYARMGLPKQSRPHLREAAREFEEIGSNMFAVRAYLEAAGVCALEANYRGGLRDLIAAYPLFDSQNVDCPEWVLLGQISMFVEFRDDQLIHEQIHPGFTLAIHGPNPEAANMLPQGPLVTLARACVALDRPYRSANYFRQIIATVSPENRASIAAMALPNPILIHDLVEFCTLSVLATEAKELKELSLEMSQQHHAFLFDYVIGNAIFQFLNLEPERMSVAEKALSAARESGIRNDAVELFVRSLGAIVQFEKSGEIADLVRAFEEAVAKNAIAVARHLSWFWLFRSTRARPIEVYALIDWIARLASLSLAVGSPDKTYLSETCMQLQTLLQAFEHGSQGRIMEMLRVLQANAETPRNALLGVQEIALADCAEFHHAGDFPLQLQVAALSPEAANLSRSIESYCKRLLQMLLIPTALDVEPQLKSYVRAIGSEIESWGRKNGDVAENCGRVVSQVSLFAEFIETGQTFPEQLELLLYWGNELPKNCTPTAAANYYIHLRHSIAAVPVDSSLAATVANSLNSEHAQLLSVDPDIPDYMRIRLRTCIWSSRAFLLYQRIIRADALRKSLTHLKSEFHEAICTVNEIIHLTSLKAGRYDHFAAAFEAANFCRTVGLTFSKRDDDWAQGCLNLAAEYFVTALGSSLSSEWANKDAVPLVRAVILGLQTANMLHDEKYVSIFERALSELKQRDGLQAIIDQESEINDLARLAHAPLPPNEEELEEFVDHIMRENKIPVRFRSELTAEAKLMALSQQEHQTFCKFLKPVRFPDVPPTFSAECEHFGHKLSFEQLDAESAVAGFKSVFCINCISKCPLDKIH